MNYDDGHMVVSFSGVAVCFVCMVLYLVNGGMAFASASTASIVTVVKVGCIEWPGVTGNCQYLEPMQVIPTFTAGDRLDIVSWGFGVLVVGHIVYASVFFCPFRYVEKFEMWIKLPLLCVIFVGGILAIAASVVKARHYSVSFQDCRAAYQSQACGFWEPGAMWYCGCVVDNVTLPGSLFGFWTEWGQSAISVVASLFTW
jgi:hypothetical protein